MKIHIIGCSGTGKTYLAKFFAEKYGIPHFDLDEIQWDNSSEGYGVKMPIEKRAQLLQEILFHKEWIIEGVYYSWVQQCFEEADRIYVLDMPKYLYKTRIIKRSMRRLFGLEQGKQETLKSVLALLKWTDTFHNTNLKEIKVMLEKYGDKVIWITNKKEVKAILAQKVCEM